MRVAVICDTHAGCRSESGLFFDSAARFYGEVFFPAIDRLGIRTVVHLGDLVDRRKYVAFVTANRLRRDFVQPIVDRGLEFIVMPGNHDLPYRDLCSVNAERELLPAAANVRIVDAPQVWRLDDRPFLMLPWICAENRQASLDLIKAREARAVLGHLELAGHEMYRGVVRDHGMDGGLFSRYESVMSGHYHQKSDKGNVHYLGAPFEMNWSDYDCPRGFHVLDTDTLELTHVANPNAVFTKLMYDDTEPLDENTFLRGLCDRTVRGKVAKIVVVNKTDPVRYDRFVTIVEEYAASVQVVDDHKHADGVSDEEIAAPVTDTLELLGRCVDEADARCDKGELRRLLADLYRQAQELDA